MFNHQYISIYVIIDKIKRGNLYKELSQEAAIDYTVECLRLMNSDNLYITKPGKIIINQYKGKLPEDMKYIVQCTRVLGDQTVTNNVSSYDYVDNSAGIPQCVTFVPMRYGTDNFHSLYHCSYSLDLWHNWNNNYDYKPEYTYTLNNNLIQTNFEKGIVFMAYKGLKVDDECLPMIPDNVSVQKAIEYYIKYNFLEDMGTTDNFVERRKQSDEQNYCWYIGQAQNSLKSLTMDEYESFANMMSKMYVEETQHGMRLNKLGVQEFRLNQ